MKKKADKQMRVSAETLKRLNVLGAKHSPRKTHDEVITTLLAHKCV